MDCRISDSSGPIPISVCRKANVKCGFMAPWTRCVIDEEDHFIRGVISIPVQGEDDAFGIGVCVSQKQENFKAYLENFVSPDIGPFFGWLSNRIPFYEQDTWALKTMVRFQGNNQRPLIEVEPSDHPLFLDSSEGITLEQAWRYAHCRGENGVGT